MPEPFMIELQSGEIVSVFAMYDAEGAEVLDRSEARQFGVERADGSCALLRLHPKSEIEKVTRQ